MLQLFFKIYFYKLFFCAKSKTPIVNLISGIHHTLKKFSLNHTNKNTTLRRLALRQTSIKYYFILVCVKKKF